MNIQINNLGQLLMQAYSFAKNYVLDSKYEVINNKNTRILKVTNSSSVHNFSFNNNSNTMFDSYKIEPKNMNGNLELEAIIKKNHKATLELEPIKNKPHEYNLKSLNYSGPNINFKYP